MAARDDYSYTVANVEAWETACLHLLGQKRYNRTRLLPRGHKGIAYEKGTFTFDVAEEIKTAKQIMQIPEWLTLPVEQRLAVSKVINYAEAKMRQEDPDDEGDDLQM